MSSKEQSDKFEQLFSQTDLDSLPTKQSEVADDQKSFVESMEKLMSSQGGPYPLTKEAAELIRRPLPKQI